MEKPTRRDLIFWKGAIQTITSAGYHLQNCLGSFCGTKHRQERWYVSEGERHLYHKCEQDFEGGHDLFNLQTNRPTWCNKTYTFSSFTAQTVPVTRYASVEPITDDKVTLHSTIILPAPPMPMANFWDTLDSFRNQSLWNYTSTTRGRLMDNKGFDGRNASNGPWWIIYGGCGSYSLLGGIYHPLQRDRQWSYFSIVEKTRWYR